MVVSRDKYFFVGPINQISIFCMSADGFHNMVFVEFELVSFKSLTNSENPSYNPLQEACSGFQVAACDYKRCSEIWILVIENVVCT